MACSWIYHYIFSIYYRQMCPYVLHIFSDFVGWYQQKNSQAALSKCQNKELVKDYNIYAIVEDRIHVDCAAFDYDYKEKSIKNLLWDLSKYKKDYTCSPLDISLSDVQWSPSSSTTYLIIQLVTYYITYVVFRLTQSLMLVWWQLIFTKYEMFFG